MAWQYGHEHGYIACHVNVTHKVKMLCVMTEFTTSSNVWSSIGTEQSLHHTFPSNILTLAMTCTGFSKCGNSSILLSLSHLPFLLLTCGGLIATTASKPRLLSSFFPPLLFGFFHLKQGFVWWVWTVHNPLRNQSMQSIQAFANLSVHRVF